MSSESPITSTSSAPIARARSSPSSSARYSATLLVAVPSSCACSSSSSPSLALITDAAAAGPGLPRAPPSTCTMTFKAPRQGLAPAPLAADTRQRGHVPGHASPAPVAYDAALRGAVGDTRIRALPARTPIELAAIDDHGHIVVVLVVGEQLRIELVCQLSGHHRIDHVPGSYWSRARTPSASATAFATHSSRESSASSVPWTTSMPAPGSSTSIL